MPATQAHDRRIVAILFSRCLEAEKLVNLATDTWMDDPIISPQVVLGKVNVLELLCGLRGELQLEIPRGILVKDGRRNNDASRIRVLEQIQEICPDHARGRNDRLDHDHRIEPFPMRFHITPAYWSYLCVVFLARRHSIVPEAGEGNAMRPHAFHELRQ